jgi:hypothetical protein
MNRVLGGVIATLVLVVAAVAAPAAAASGTPLSFLLKWGTPGSGAGQFDRPLFVAVDDVGSVYVTDNGNHRVQKFDANGNHIGGWGSYGPADGQFNAPRGIAFFDGNEADPANYVYVVDSLNHRVQKFSTTGALITKWGTMGTGDGEFMVPSGIAVGPSGAVYVGDMSHHRIQKFSPTGAFLGKWGSNGTGDGQFVSPQGIAVDAQERVYVADAGYPSRVQVFSAGGSHLGTWTSFGTGTYSPFTASGVAVGQNGDVYVSDMSNFQRVLQFTATGTPIADWSVYVNGEAGGPSPFGLAVAWTGDLYVADMANHCVKKFGRSSGSSDTTPPVTKVGGDYHGWYNHPVTLTFTATDEAGGSGVARTEARIEDLLLSNVWGPWTPGTTFVVPAPSDHSQDGDRMVQFRSVDVAGNIEAARRAEVRIDTRKPRVTVDDAVAHPGQRALVTFHVRDAWSPKVKVIAQILKGSTVVHKATSKWLKKKGTSGWGFTCALRRGKYTLSITASDLAHNWSPPGKARLVVK